MTRSSNSVQSTPLDELLQKADADTLRDLARNLIGRRRKAQRESLDFLRQRLDLSDRKRREAAGQSVLMLWHEAEWYLEIDDREGDENRASDLLADLAERLRDEQIPKQVRRYVISEGIAYVDSSNCTDALYDVLYAACYNDDDLRDLAENLEGIGSDWPLEHARRIYRSLGNREKYLEVRTRRLVYGLDYYDLVTFYDESGEPENALAVAKEGLEHGQGRLDELRQYLADHALRAGDRETYLKLHFEQAVQRITVESYQHFQQLCTDSERVGWEQLLMAAVAQAPPEERLRIHLLRGESEQAVAVLSSLTYPLRYGNSSVLEAAAALERQYPEQVLAFYRKGLGDVSSAHQRNEYARKAQVLLKMRHMWAEVMGKPAVWEQFARNVKAVNYRRPALQEEFGKVIPDWKSL